MTWHPSVPWRLRVSSEVLCYSDCASFKMADIEFPAHRRGGSQLSVGIRNRDFPVKRALAQTTNTLADENGKRAWNWVEVAACALVVELMVEFATLQSSSAEVADPRDLNNWTTISSIHLIKLF